MHKFKKAALSAVAVAGLTASFLAPSAFADTSILISGNGYRSDNSVSVDQNSSTTVVQSNDATFVNNVTTSNNTGGNSASRNTGGDVTIVTGDAESFVDISNSANRNELSISGCGTCGHGGSDILIVGNGAHSDNRVDVDSDHEKFFGQFNDADFRNSVNTHNNTGGNSAGGGGYNSGYDWSKRYGSSGSYDHKNDSNYQDSKNYHQGNQVSYNYDQKKDEHHKYDSKSFDKNYDHNYQKSDYYDHNKSYNVSYNKDYLKEHNYSHNNDNSWVWLSTYNFWKNQGKNHNIYPTFHKPFSFHFGGHGGFGGNTGGDVSIITGDALSDVNIHNQANSNFLRLY
jgi:hypothetical protein